jgi:hypothetical protein
MHEFVRGLEAFPWLNGPVPRSGVGLLDKGLCALYHAACPYVATTKDAAEH